MVEDEYLEQTKEFNLQIDDLSVKFSTDRIKLEEQFDQTINAIAKQIEENEQQLIIYRQKGREAIELIDDLHKSTANDFIT